MQTMRTLRTATLRIGNAGGYWGDDPYALRRQVLGPLPLDYVSIDYLAEITMSILQKQYARDASAGYAKDFVTQVEPLLEEILKRKIRIITNAGGVNPMGCAEALFEVARRRGVSLKVAVVSGDDLKDRIEELRARGIGLANMETGEELGEYRDKILSANAYFGAMPVVEALERESGYRALRPGDRHRNHSRGTHPRVRMEGRRLRPARARNRRVASHRVRGSGDGRQFHRLGKSRELCRHRISHPGVRAGRELRPDQASGLRRNGQRSRRCASSSCTRWATRSSTSLRTPSPISPPCPSRATGRTGFGSRALPARHLPTCSRSRPRSKTGSSRPGRSS